MFAAELLRSSLQVLSSSGALMRNLKLLQSAEALQRRGGVLQEEEEEEEEEEVRQTHIQSYLFDCIYLCYYDFFCDHDLTGWEASLFL